MKDRETPKNVYSIKIKQTQGAKVMSREGKSPNRLLRFLSRWSVSEIVHRCFHSKARLGSSHALRIALKLMELGGGHRKCCGAKLAHRNSEMKVISFVVEQTLLYIG